MSTMKALKFKQDGRDESLILIYDISNDRKRNRFFKFMKGYGKNVQKSSFELKLNKTKFAKLIEDIPRYIDKEDSVIVYKIHSKAAEFFETGKEDPNEADIPLGADVIIV